MEDENKKKELENIKLFLPLRLGLRIFEEIENKYGKCDPFTKIITRYDEIEKIKEDESVIQLLYFNRKNIHQILYEKEEFLNIEDYKFEDNLSSYFYLILLIEDNPIVIECIYSLDFFIEINKQNNNNDEIFKKIIFSLIILALIKNYRNNP